MSVKRPRLRRRYRRRTVRVRVEYENEGGKCEDTATTLGAGGMFISTAEPLDEQTRIRVRFQLHSGGALHELEARVVWSNRPSDPATRGCGMGIEFIDPKACGALALELERLED